MSTANHVIQVRVNKSVKDAAASVAAGIGIPLSTLVNAFVTRLAWEGKMPFELMVPQYNSATLEAFAEANAIADGSLKSEPMEVGKFFEEMGA